MAKIKHSLDDLNNRREMAEDMLNDLGQIIRVYSVCILEKKTKSEWSFRDIQDGIKSANIYVIKYLKDRKEWALNDPRCVIVEFSSN